MIKYEIKGTDTYYYREMLPNGLDIILLPDDNDKRKNYFINFGTYYGALTNSFVPYGKKKKWLIFHMVLLISLNINVLRWKMV